MILYTRDKFLAILYWESLFFNCCRIYLLSQSGELLPIFIAESLCLSEMLFLYLVTLLTCCQLIYVVVRCSTRWVLFSFVQFFQSFVDPVLTFLKCVCHGSIPTECVYGTSSTALFTSGTSPWVPAVLGTTRGSFQVLVNSKYQYSLCSSH